MSHLTDSERSEISILKSKGYSNRTIGVALCRPHTTIGRELQRNRTMNGYDPRIAKLKARNRRKCSKYQGMKVRENFTLQDFIVEKLKQKWTPEEISGRIRSKEKQLPYISAKGIYKWLYSVHGHRYCRYLMSRRYRPKKYHHRKTIRVMIPDRIGIECRPEAVNRRSRFGHFETDTMVSGKRHRSTAALTVLHERKARFTRIQKIPCLKPEVNAAALCSIGKNLRRKTITHDNGLENKNHQAVARTLKVKTYFCRPYHSWEKGSVENTIGRIRRFIPKGANIADYSDEQIAEIEHWLNHTPRKCLQFRTPYEIMIKNLRFISPSPSGAFEG